METQPVEETKINAPETFLNTSVFAHGTMYWTTDDQQRTTWFDSLITKLKWIDVGACEIEKREHKKGSKTITYNIRIPLEYVNILNNFIKDLNTSTKMNIKDIKKYKTCGFITLKRQSGVEKMSGKKNINGCKIRDFGVFQNNDGTQYIQLFV